MADWIEGLKKYKWMRWFLVFQIVVLLILGVRIINIQRTMTIVSPNLSCWQSRYIQYENDSWTATENVAPEGEKTAYFDLIYGPFFSLPMGLYAVNIEYECEHSQRMSVYSFENGDAIHQFEFENIAKENSIETYHFLLSRDVDDLEVRVQYSGEGVFRIKNIYISDTAFYHKLLIAIIAFTFALIDLLIFGMTERECAIAATQAISEHRNIVMAMAIILVMFFHSKIDFGVDVLNRIRDTGYCGVDFFVFATGIGCYFSFLKDRDVGAYIRRRMCRILPTYYICIIPWIIYMMIEKEMPVKSAIGNLTFVELFAGTDYCFNWYASAMWLYYILLPFIAVLIEKKVNNVAVAIVAVILSFITTIPFWGSDMVTLAARIPILVLGLIFAKMIKGDIQLHRYAGVLGLALCAGAGLLLLVFMESYLMDAVVYKGFYFYPFILVVPGVSVLIGWIALLLEKSRVGSAINKCVEILGESTFEAYMLHIILFKVVCVGDLERGETYWVVILLVIILSPILRKMTRKMVRICR